MSLATFCVRCKTGSAAVLSRTALRDALLSAARILARAIASAGAANIVDHSYRHDGSPDVTDAGRATRNRMLSEHRAAAGRAPGRAPEKQGIVIETSGAIERIERGSAIAAAGAGRPLPFDIFVM